MDKEFAGLSIDEEEDEILQFQPEHDTLTEEQNFNLVGCFLTASVIHFPAMKSTMANLWHLVKGVQIQDLGEKRSGEGEKEFYADKGSAGCEATIKKEKKGVFCCAWLREEGEDGPRRNGNVSRLWGGNATTESEVAIDPVLGINLKGNKSKTTQGKANMIGAQTLSEMDHDLEDRWFSRKQKFDREESFIIGGCQEASRPVTMKILSWNVRGLGNQRTIQRLRQTLKTHNPQLVFLMETNVSKVKMERVRRRLGFINGIEVDSDGSRGGLCLAWTGVVSVGLKSFSKRHIDVLATDQNEDHQWRFTGFYGSPYAREREDSWNLLRRLGQNAEQPRLVCGDFNEIMYGSEKICGLPREERRMEAFRNVLEDYRLMDLGYSGHWFTWERGNLPETNIRERLDRGVANVNWMSRFPETNVKHLLHSTSDHCPLLVTTTNEESFETEVEAKWAVATGNLLQKLEYLKSELRKWAAQMRISRSRKKKFLSSKLADLMEAERTDSNLEELIDTKLQLNFEIDKEESYWEQRARVNWLKLGDRNTKFFHKDQQEMAGIARLYFQGLFQTEGRGQYEHILSGVRRCILDDDNRCLAMAFTKEEIWEALSSMGATKAPGEDGLPAIFFQKLWHIVGNEVTAFYLEQLNGGMEVSQLNSTHIVLIPKKVRPTNLSHFKPISLCNVIYKIMAKAVANRFRGVLEKCIDKAQSAFVPGRLISDNALIAYEILNALKKKRTGRKGLMAVKLDMSKAYDRVEWTFLEKMMDRMGFELGWINLVMRCISTVSYAVILNRQIGNNFYPSRGLRQGDPLSPFLFLICGEGLSSLMRLAQSEENFRGVKASRRGPQISHLLFANDCILFGEATERGAGLLKRLLREYRACSGQHVNFDKSTVFFSSNTTEADKDLVTRMMGVWSSNDPERYLGLPNMVGKRKKEAFQILKDRFRQRINNWSVRHLSQGGKQVFIKAVLQVIPTYTMACFLLPKTLCSEIETKKLLKEGMCWRVGKGDRISVWTDRWIPGIDTVSIGQRDNNTEIELVAGLIDTTTRRWKRGLIKNTFPEQIAQKILQIPLAEVEHDDLQVWRGEHSGEFTVRSAYKLLQEADADPNDLLLQANSKNFYRKLWNLQLPAKIGITIWRFTWNFVPTLSNLKLRKVVNIAVCPRCRNTEEDSNHVLRQCPESIELWQRINLSWVIISNISDLWSWFTWVFDRGSNNQCRLFCYAIWMLWFSRNKLVHENKTITGADLSQRVTLLKNLTGLRKDRNAKSTSGLVVWGKENEWLASKTVLHSATVSSFMAEAQAGLQAAKLGVLMGFQTVTIIGDSKTVIKKCNSTDSGRSGSAQSGGGGDEALVLEREGSSHPQPREMQDLTDGILSRLQQGAEQNGEVNLEHHTFTDGERNEAWDPG
ncbi:reverse transcriptase [Gossypium australe]|uniref:Reverse transcriptase n=1 Tax=Gossypium australe TaxID=47621 RepID=A0A5B6VT12_9ROSI|nr:reverse transcriptase [Gossypium australe]